PLHPPLHLRLRPELSSPVTPPSPAGPSCAPPPHGSGDPGAGPAMASIRSSGGILAPPLLRRMLDLARRGRQSCPAFDRAVALSATLPLLSADAGRRRRRPRESGDAGGAPCAGQPIGSARCSERAGSSRTAAVDSIARGCAPSAPCARRAHNFPLRRRSPANLGSQPTSVAPGVAVPRYKRSADASWGV
ncbi:unnamed protein product, partial [Urochloa humidicola]